MLQGEVIEQIKLSQALENRIEESVSRSRISFKYKDCLKSYDYSFIFIMQKTEIILRTQTGASAFYAAFWCPVLSHSLFFFGGFVLLWAPLLTVNWGIPAMSLFPPDWIAPMHKQETEFKMVTSN